MKTILLEIYTLLTKIWNHVIFTMDGQPVSISNIVLALFFLSVGIKIANKFGTVIQSRLLRIINIDVNVSNFFGKIIHYILILVVTVIALDIAHVPLTAFTFIGGALAVSIGVGSQHVMNNFISGLVLMIENSIKVGDLVEIGQFIGRVISIDVRSVSIKTQENKNLYIPHSTILQNEVLNWTSNGNKVKLATVIHLNHNQVNLDEVKDILKNAVSNINDVLISPEPKVLAMRFDHDIVELEVNFWVNLAFVNRREIVSEVNYVISNSLKNNNIELAVQQRRILK